MCYYNHTTTNMNILIQQADKQQKEIKENLKKQIPKMVRRCMNHFKSKEYSFGITKEDVDKAVKLTRIKDLSTDHATYGGRDVIQINLNLWHFWTERRFKKGKDSDLLYVSEYASFRDNKIYGARYAASVEDIALMVVAHEVCHHIQRKFFRKNKKHDKPHGDGFQYLYRCIRAYYVNPIMDKNIEIFRGQQVPESKSEKFKRLSEARLNNVIKSIQLVGNLANRNNYSYTQEEINKIYSRLGKEIKLLNKRFELQQKENKIDFKL